MKAKLGTCAAGLWLACLLCVPPSIAFGDALTESWVRRYGGIGDSSDAAFKLAVDGSSNVVVVGYTDDGIRGWDWLIVKYSNGGVPLWTNRYNSVHNGFDEAKAVAIDSSGNVVVAGMTDYLSTNQQLTIIKYSSGGIAVWTNRYSGPFTGNDFTGAGVDGNGNVFVTVDAYATNEDIVTLKYSSAGVPLWTNRYDGGFGGDQPHGLAVDGPGNVVVTGGSYRGNTNTDYVTIKYSSAGAVVWTKLYDGPTGDDDTPSAVAVDGSGNVFVTGSSRNGTNVDYATIRYNSGGGAVSWTKRYNGSGNNGDVATAIATDSGGNVLVTGYSWNGTNDDYVTIKYSNTGVAQWTNRYSASGDYRDVPNAIAVASNGNVFVTGLSMGRGAGPYFDSGLADYATVTYSSAGVMLWTNRYNGSANNSDQANAVATDSSGNVFVTGTSVASSGLTDFATLKYATNGSGLWTNRYTGRAQSYDVPYALAVDDNGNVIVSGMTANGRAADYATIKYSAAGSPLWTNTFNGPDDQRDVPSAMRVDGSGHVIVTGYSYRSGGDQDFATIKYSDTGASLWTNFYNGLANSNDFAVALAMDSSGGIVVTGSSLSTATNFDYATVKYSSEGVPLWTNRFNGAGNGRDQAKAIAIDSSGNVFVTGNSVDAFGLQDYATVKYSSSGFPLWTNCYNGSANGAATPVAIAVDRDGNVIVTGSSSRGTNYDYGYVTIKYSNAGAPLWTNSYYPPSEFSSIYAVASDLAVNREGDVFVTGSRDPFGFGFGYQYATVAYLGSGLPSWTNIFEAGGQTARMAVDSGGNVFVTGSDSRFSQSGDYVTIAYSKTGVPWSTNRYNGPANRGDSPTSIAIGRDGALFVAGSSDESLSTGSLASAGPDFATVKYVYALRPAIDIQPANRTNVVGSTTTFSITASGSPPLNYQWQKEGTNLLNTGSISGATTPFLAIANIAAEDAGSYAVVVTNSSGSVTSAVATLTVVVPACVVSPPAIDGAELVVRFGGTPGISYTIEYTDTISPAEWHKSATFTGTGTFEFRASLIGAEQRFFRSVYPSY